MLSLMRLSRRRFFPPGGEAIYRHMARLAELEPGDEFLLMPCGRGVTTQFLAQLTGAVGSGVDPDGDLLAWAEHQAKQAGLATQLHYEQAPLTDLPYRDDVFDVVQRCFDRMRKDCNRISCTIKVDYRKGHRGRLQAKTGSVEQRLKRKLKTS
jgi:uncharacterized protein YqgV (UPF0045/DUF77 family)